MPHTQQFLDPRIDIKAFVSLIVDFEILQSLGDRVLRVGDPYRESLVVVELARLELHPFFGSLGKIVATAQDAAKLRPVLIIDNTVVQAYQPLSLLFQ